MPKVSVYNQNGEEVGKIELAGKIFNIKENEALVHQAVVAQMANERQVLAHTKGRSEVRGGGRKPWKQKGTGRARQGSIRAPQWVGGGIVFGPSKQRNFSKKINKKMRQKAIFMALSNHLAAKNLTVLDKIELVQFKTRPLNEIFKNLEKKVWSGEAGKGEEAKRNILIMDEKNDKKIKYSGRNLPGVKISNLDNINIVDLLKYRNLILTVDGVKELEKRYAGLNQKSKIITASGGIPPSKSNRSGGKNQK